MPTQKLVRRSTDMFATVTPQSNSERVAAYLHRRAIAGEYTRSATPYPTSGRSADLPSPSNDGPAAFFFSDDYQAVYGDYLMQLAAYRVLWEEVHPDQPLTGGFHLCRFSKDHGDFAHHYFRELDGAWEMFRHLRAAYDYDRELKKRAA